METTRLVVAVTQHVVLMVELLLPFVVSSRFKIACDTSSAVICFLFLGVQWEGKATFDPVMVLERQKTLTGFQ